MGDKSPRQHMAKKSGKSLKEKRTQKREKVAERERSQADQFDELLHRKQR